MGIPFLVLLNFFSNVEALIHHTLPFPTRALRFLSVGYHLG
jgi:hypothetical protein